MRKRVALQFKYKRAADTVGGMQWLLPYRMYFCVWSCDAAFRLKIRRQTVVVKMLRTIDKISCSDWNLLAERSELGDFSTSA